jgi:uncharacterized membrane protein YhaH (DUF805 family)
MSLRALLSPAGRIAPLPFVIAAAGVYLAGFASQVLLSPPVTGSLGVLPFALVQAALIWTWYGLHARRLRDAGRSTGLAAGIALVYALQVLLLVLLVWLILAFADAPAERGWSQAGILNLLVFLYLLTLLADGSNLGTLQVWIIGFAVLMLLPVVIAVCFSLWAATRPSVPPKTTFSSAP